MRLTVSPAGEIRLTVPHFINPQQINKFLETQSQWLQRVLEKITPPEKVDFKDGNKINIIDEQFTLKIYSPHSESKVYVDDKEKTIHIFSPRVIPDLSKKEFIHLKKLLKKNLIQFARKKITFYTDQVCERAGTNYNRISIREQKSRWGSCSNKGNLNFNWKIVLAPKPVFLYVIVHEVAHLLEHNHSPAFWQIVYDLHPSYKQDRAWLKENASQLEII